MPPVCLLLPTCLRVAGKVRGVLLFPVCALGSRAPRQALGSHHATQAVEVGNPSESSS